MVNEQDLHGLYAFGLTADEESLVSRRLDDTLSEFRNVAFPRGFGFDAYSRQDIVRYLVSPDHYNLSLKKVRGKGILYGKVHAELRRQFFNQLPREVKINCLVPKLRHFGLQTILSDYFGMRSQIPITDVEDIGMGHSVYRISTPMGDVVLKQESVPNQQFYIEFQRALGYPWFKSRHYVGYRAWELTEYLGPVNLNDLLISGEVSDWPALIRQLARQAAMGDVLGREDRHVENYLVQRQSILPVDTSMLFGHGNEQWSNRYVCGGLYEICVLDRVPSEESQALRGCFEQEYRNQFKQLVDRADQIYRLVSEFFGETGGPSHRLEYIRHRLEDDGYPDAQFKMYYSGLITMRERYQLKEKIRQVAYDSPKILDQSPIIKMYYLADLDRVSALFLFEEHQDQLLNELERFGVLTECGRHLAIERMSGTNSNKMSLKMRPR